MKKIIVLAIPGIGTKQKNFSKPLEEAIRRHAADSEMIQHFHLIELLPFKESLIDLHEQQLFDRMIAQNDLGGVFSLRKFIMQGFNDALTFERDAQSLDSPYKIIHRYLRAEIRKVTEVMDNNPGSRLVIVAGSLGAHVLSTYIWDADNNLGIFHEHNADRTENLRNLDYLASIGCNIPLLVSGIEASKIIAIDKRGLDFEWDNFYDKDDVLGWPLKQLSPSYEMLVNDFEINTGVYIGSHIRYWSDDDFTKPLCKKLIELYNT